MLRKNFAGRKKTRREAALARWEEALEKARRGKVPKIDAERVASAQRQIERLEAKLLPPPPKPAPTLAVI